MSRNLLIIMYIGKKDLPDFHYYYGYYAKTTGLASLYRGKIYEV